jgi:2-oxoisovalerate dehydrogenase E2 component (dihydrolipoyl transacylase)
MIKTFILPDIGEGIVECEIIEWLIQEGETIEEDQAVAEVMTDKAVVEIPAPFSGVVRKLLYQKGDVAPVHQPLFEVEVLAQSASASGATEVDDVQNNDIVNLKHASCPEDQDLTEEEFQKHVIDMPLHDDEPMVLPDVVGSSSASILATPAVRGLAREQGIDLKSVQGSGQNGRVHREDLEQHRPQPAQKMALVRSAQRTEKLTGMRLKMAQSMAKAVQEIPHFTYCDELDVTALLSLRGYMKQDGQPIGWMPFFMKALSFTLQKFPIINSQFDAETQELTYFDDHHVGFAMDSKLGLLVPNVKGCQLKSIQEIEAEIQRMLVAGKEGKMSPEDLQQGTVTVSNIGSIGGTIATPIIHQSQAAIVALGKVQRLPRLNDKDEVQARSIMQVSWSADHRIVDGATMARCSNHWKMLLEAPEQMLLRLR